MTLATMTTQDAIAFALDLEAAEETMPENAAMAATLDAYGLTWGDQCNVLAMLPDGEWWLQDERLKKTA